MVRRKQLFGLILISCHLFWYSKLITISSYGLVLNWRELFVILKCIQQEKKKVTLLYWAVFNEAIELILFLFLKCKWIKTNENSKYLRNFCFFYSVCSQNRQIGDAGVTCMCPKGFKGKKCQIPEDEDINGMCVNITKKKNVYKIILLEYSVSNSIMTSENM